VLIGETGCGKTRLIKFMCDLLSLDHPGSTVLKIMKVCIMCWSLYNAYNSDDYLTEIFLIDNNIYEAAYATITLASSLYSYKHLSVIILNLSSIICYRVKYQQLNHD